MTLDDIFDRCRHDPLTDCRIWTGTLTEKGYARTSIDGRTTRVARYAYELVNGPLPRELMPDHLCRTPACCNPDHLEPVSNRVNILRGNSPSAIAARQTHCKHGHPFSGDNLIIDTGSHQRVCRTCKNASHRLYRARKRQSATLTS